MRKLFFSVPCSAIYPHIANIPEQWQNNARTVTIWQCSNQKQNLAPKYFPWFSASFLGIPTVRDGKIFWGSEWVVSLAQLNISKIHLINILKIFDFWLLIYYGCLHYPFSKVPYEARFMNKISICKVRFLGANAFHCRNQDGYSLCVLQKIFSRANRRYTCFHMSRLLSTWILRPKTSTKLHIFLVLEMNVHLTTLIFP